MHSKERGSKLYGAMVITLDEGIRIGRVYEVYIDKAAKQIMGISYKAGSWSMERELYVDMADIHKFSQDVVIITGRDAAKERPEGMHANALRGIRGYKITTQAGKHIGELTDLVIDRKDGGIVEILLSGNQKLQIDMSEVVIGPDLILIPADKESFITTADPEPGDFVNRLFTSTGLSETFKEGYEGVRSSFRNSIQSDKVKESLKSGSILARDTVLRTSQFIQHTIDQMRKRPDPDADKPKESPEETVVEVNTGETMGTTDPIQDLGPEEPPRTEGMEWPKKDEPPR
jgi:sporulation protein YlmC with PRC-barrel domain